MQMVWLYLLLASNIATDQNFTFKHVCKPTTRTEKLWRIKLAIRFMIRGKDDQLYTKGMRIIDCIEEWTRGHSKDIAIQRQEHPLVMKQRLQNIIDPNEFLEHNLVQLT